jgi:inorganic triphosphatase YgiF
MRTRAETERKYEAGAVGELPAFDDLPGVAVSGVDTQTLEAVYFDTPGLRMSRAGVTLRSRTGGDDPGWHLKMPIDGDIRDEMQMPLDAAASSMNGGSPRP